jgi:hypothetical protein
MFCSAGTNRICRTDFIHSVMQIVSATPRESNAKTKFFGIRAKPDDGDSTNVEPSLDFASNRDFRQTVPRL